MDFFTFSTLKPNRLLDGNIYRIVLMLSLCVICSQIVYTPIVRAQIHQKQWDKTFGGDQYDYLSTLIETKDGGYLLGGDSDSDSSYDKSQSTRGSSDFWIVKTDSAGTKLWDRRFGGDSFEQLSSVIQTVDGGYLLAGYSASGIGGDITEDSLGGVDFWVVKTDSMGNKLWDNRYGGKGADGIFAAVQTSDGGFVLGGVSDSGISEDKSEDTRGGFDYWVIKIDKNGGKLWDKRFGGQDNEILYSIIQTREGDFLLAGFSASGISGDKTEESRGAVDYWVVKIDSSGSKLWDKRFGGYGYDQLSVAIPTSDEGYLLAGQSDSGMGGDKTEDSRSTSQDYWVVKIDKNGIKLWDKRFGGDNYEYLQSAINTMDGGFLLAGYSASDIGGDKSEDSRGFSDYWIVRTDSSGTKLWDKRFGGNSIDELYSAIQTKDGSFLLGGLSGSNISGDKTEESRGGFSWDYWIVKTYLAPPPPEPYYVMKDTTITTCSGTFFDPGFTSAYTNSIQYTQTFLPAISVNKIRITFGSFGLSSDDYLYMYDGTTTNSPLIGVFSSSTSSPDTIIASNAQGALTFHFISDTSGTGPGWQAAISCVDSTFSEPAFISALWNKRFGGEGVDYLHTAIPTSDGGFLLGGSSASGISEDKSDLSRGEADYWVVKTDSSGIRLWDKTFGGDAGDYIKTVIETPDGGYLLAGDSQSQVSGDKTAQNHGPTTGAGFTPDIWLVKIDKDGNKLWDKTLGGDNTEYINSIIRTKNGNYLIAGASLSGASGDKSEDSRGGFDFWLVEIDTDGNKLWDKRYGGSNDDYMNFVIQNKENGYLLAGISWSTAVGDKSEPTRGNSDYWVVRIDDSGNKLWDKRFGGSLGDYLNSGLQTEDGGYLLAGDSESGMEGDRTEDSRGSFDHWLVKIDAFGHKQWDKRYGGNSYDGLRSLIRSADGGYVLAGESMSGISGDKTVPSKGSLDYWVVKTDQFGNKLWDKTFGGTAYDAFRFAIPVNDGSLLLGGSSESGIGADKSENNRGLNDYWIVRTTPEIYLPTPFLVNFQDKFTRTPQAWIKDYGLPFSEQNLGGMIYTFGWKNRSTAAPVDLSGNGRKRPAPSDVLLASLMHMQGNDVKNFRGTPVESFWEVAVENGEYQVSVSVGDGAKYTVADVENHSVQVEGVPAITGFIPQEGSGSSSRFAQATVRVTVNDGLLSILADGGTNTKINYAIIQPLGSATIVRHETAELQAAESQPITGQAFPNPFSDQVSVRLLPEIEGNLLITIQDVRGFIHYQTQLANQHSVVSLDVASVPLKTGIYMIAITAENGFRQVSRVVKK